MSKRGMSPIIATILLISFAVSIGAVIMSYGNAYSPNELEEDICKEAALEVFEIAGQPQICKTTEAQRTIFSFIMFNKGDIPIESVQVVASLIGKPNTVKVLEISGSRVLPGSDLQRQISIDTGGRELAQIEFISIIGTDHKKCYSSPIISIPDC